MYSGFRIVNLYQLYELGFGIYAYFLLLLVLESLLITCYLGQHFSFTTFSEIISYLCNIVRSLLQSDPLSS